MNITNCFYVDTLRLVYYCYYCYNTIVIHRVIIQLGSQIQYTQFGALELWCANTKKERREMQYRTLNGSMYVLLYLSYLHARSLPSL